MTQDNSVSVSQPPSTSYWSRTSLLLLNALQGKSVDNVFTQRQAILIVVELHSLKYRVIEDVETSAGKQINQTQSKIQNGWRFPHFFVRKQDQQPKAIASKV